MMTRYVFLLLTSLLLSGGLSFTAQANTPSLSLHGFGTLGMVYSSEDNADYVSHRMVPKGAGHSTEWSSQVDSRLGLQLTANLSPRVSGVVQVVTEQQHDGDFSPGLEWANVNFEVTRDLSLRAGRMQQSSFMMSEYRKVGYAIPWVRPPDEVYRVIPVTYIDGIDVNYRYRFGEYTQALRLIYGSADSKAAGGFDLDAREAIGLTGTLERGATSIFAGYGQYTLTMPAMREFFDIYRFFGPEGDAIADRYEIEGSRVRVYGLGVRHDPGDWFVIGEWSRSKSQTLLGDVSGWYLSGGYRFGNVTPYVTLARARIHSNTSDPGLSAGEFIPVAAQMNYFLNEALGAAAKQRSISFGARWDFAPNMALKAQFDHIDMDAGSPGVLVNVQPDFEPGGSVNLFSLSLDFVF